MIIVSENATEILVKDLEAAFERNSTERCLYISANYFATSLHQILETLASEISQLLEQDRLKLYLCEDGDAYFIAPTLTRKRIYDLLERLQFFVKPQTNPNAIVKIFELGNGIHAILLHAQEKFDVILTLRENERRAQEEKLRLEREEQERAILNLKITDSLKAQVQQRKSKKDEFEVFVIDDDIFSCKMVEALLNKFCDVSKAHNAWQAITHYIQNTPDIVFLDIDMPCIDGHDILNKILEIDPHACIIMLSSHGNQDNIVRATNRGALGFIGKPFSRDKIFQYIQKSPTYAHKKPKAILHAKN